MSPFFILLLGYALLVGALVLNIGASSLGIPSWYDVIKKTRSIRPVHYLWLLLLYPLFLGIIAYGALSLLR